MTDEQHEATEPKGEVEEAAEPMTLSDAHELIRMAREAWKPITDNITACAKFEDGVQWPAEAPAGALQLTYNICPSFTNHASNIVKKNPPSIKVIPGDDGDEKTAKKYDSIIDDIENKSHAASVYTSAFEQCVASSFGMWRIVAEEVDRIDEETGEKRTELRLRHVKNPADVILDPNAEQPGFTDARWFCIPSSMTKKAFKREFPKAQLDNFETDNAAWFEGDNMMIAEFWFKDDTRDGAWTQWVISGSEVLAKNAAWPGKYIPLCVVHGRERVYEGKRTFECMTARIMDPQRVLNAETTAWVQSLDNVGGAEWLATAKQVPADYARQWNSSAKRKFLPFDPDERVPGGAPIHHPPAAVPTALMQGSTMAGEAMQKILGIRDPMKEIPGSQSGKAIALQMSQTDVAIFGYQFALEVAKTHCGCALKDLIPHFYNYPHKRNVKGRDGQTALVEFGGIGTDSDLSVGSYDIVVTSGPTWESRREEERETLLKLMGLNPEWSNIWGDLLVKSFDFEGSDVAAARLRLAMDPKFLAAGGMGENVDPKIVVSMLQSRLAQAGQQIEQMTQALQAETVEREKLQAGIEAKFQLQQADHQHDAQMQAAKTQDQIALEEMRAQIQAILKRMDIDGRAGLQESKAGIDSSARVEKAVIDRSLDTHRSGLAIREEDAKSSNMAELERRKATIQAELMLIDAEIEASNPGIRVDIENI